MGTSYDIVVNYQIEHEARKNQDPVDQASGLAKMHLMDHAGPDPEPEISSNENESEDSESNFNTSST